MRDVNAFFMLHLRHEPAPLRALHHGSETG